MNFTRQNHTPALDHKPSPPGKIDLFSSFRDRNTLEAFARHIQKKSAVLSEPVNIMEVCGSHTHAILKYSLNQALQEKVNFMHGPGCPVCVIPRERIDQAITLASLENTILVTLGDLMRVPGTKGSLALWRARGKEIRFVYSPLLALEIARQNPGKNVIFFAAGFETTTPATAYLVQRALQMKIKNIFFHINHVLVAPAMRALVDDPSHEITAFLAPPHVSVIAGGGIYEPFAGKYNLPVVVGGFEPADILEAVDMIFSQLEMQQSRVEIQYRRAADYTGNRKAQQITGEVFEVRPVFRWRGLGDIPESALRLKPEFHHLDAELIYSDILPHDEIDDAPGCLCPEILKGKKKPPQCSYFKTKCTPEQPAGACMVSTEGACAAWYKYEKQHK